MASDSPELGSHSPGSSKGAKDFQRVTFESPGTVRKYGDAFRLKREAEAMEFVSKHIQIPIPKILDTYFGSDTDGDYSWLLMTRIPGTQMGEVWPDMSEDARSNTIQDLTTIIDKLRNIPQNQSGWIGSCSRGPAYDHRLDNISTCGPFPSVSDFHDFLVAPLQRCPKPELGAKYRRYLTDNRPVVFSHADLSWENVLLEPRSGQVTGILDWEMAGFWPDWWEYRKALFGSRSKLWWMSVVNEALQNFPEETEVDMDIEMF
jgi:aminoglycoside phosphotransferase (APT) family kinase protein